MRSARSWVLALASAGGLAIAGCDNIPAEVTLDAGRPFRPDAGPMPFAGEMLPEPVIDPPPISGGHLLATADGRYAVAADPDRDAVHVFDLAGGTHAGSIELPARSEPGRLVEDWTGTVHVALRRRGEVVSIDPSTRTILERRAVCAAPRGIAADPVRSELVVACAEGVLATMPARGGSVVRTVLEPDLRDVVIGIDGLRYVSTFREAGVLVVGGDRVLERLHAPDQGEQQARVAWRLLPHPDGGVLMLHQLHSTAVIAPERGYGEPCGESIVQAVVTRLQRGGGSAVAAQLRQRVLVVDMAVQRSTALFANAGSGDPMSAVLASPLGSAPDDRGGCVEPSSTSDRPVTSVAFSVDGLRLALSRHPLSLSVGTPSGASTAIGVPGAIDPRHPGHEVFHFATSRRIACASCHPEGGEDGHTWSFVSGFRRTQDLRGGLSATRPFHWDGSVTDLRAVMTDTFTNRMGGGSLDGRAIEYAERWLDSVGAVPGLRADEGALARGRAVFEAARCGSCHAGTHFTDNRSVDVGTRGAFQVPSLLGVGQRAPYLHDGCAPTLRAALGGVCFDRVDAHTPISTLDRQQQSDLVDYLGSL